MLMAKILFIEEEKFLMQSFIWGLEEAGHRVTMAKDGEEAIRCLKGGHDYTLIILDIMLPRGNYEGSPAISEDIKAGEMGLEVLRQMREEMNDETPVIVLTAVIDDDLKTKVLGHRVKEYFAKPISVRDFLDAVKKVLASEKALSQGKQ
jgi:two-component system OmpR family response regulator